MAKEIKLPSFAEIKTKFDSGMARIRPWHPEINLVPDVKNEMIKAIKLRNLTFFICIVVASASVAVIVIFSSIAAGTQATVEKNEKTINSLSEKIRNYKELDNFVDIKYQLDNISAISKNKTLLSRAFNILPAITPTNGDTISISEFSINLSGSAPTISFDAQADALTPPYIDYNVLDSFKKSMQYLRYDYGDYVDRDGNKIPAYCIVEQGEDGKTFKDNNNNIYAFWYIAGEGCNPANSDSISEDEEDEEVALLENIIDGLAEDNELSGTGGSVAGKTGVTFQEIDGYTTETYQGQPVVRIWRTPRYSEWYREEPVEGEPYMSLSGEISGVPHFESKCITYVGTLKAATGKVDWTTENPSCYLVPDEGISIPSSSNGRSADGSLVLRFSAVITLSPEFFKFSNDHMLALGPSGRYDVTDSFVQIQSIFSAPATDCIDGDADCKSNGRSS